MALNRQHPCSVSDLADQVGSNMQDRNAGIMSLRHNHLPQLAAVGLLEWDPQTDTVTPGPHFETVLPLLDLLQDEASTLADGNR
jgi:hypothetical protein